MMKDKVIDFFYKAATSSKKVRAILTPIGATIGFIFIGSFFALALVTDSLLELPKIISGPLSIILSIPPMSIGLVIYIWALREFVKAKGTPVPLNPPPTVVTSGPYAYCRNPMLDAFFLILLGLGLLLGSMSLVFVFAPLFALVYGLEIKTIEEPELAKRLGENYIRYKNSTPMLVPRLRAKSNQGKSVNCL